MKLSMDEIIGYGKLHALTNKYLIAVNENLNIEHINSYAKKMFELKRNDHVIGKSIVSFFEQLGSPSLINTKGELSDNQLMIRKGLFHKWESLSIQVGNERWKLLIGYVVPFEIEKELKNSLEKEKLYLNNILENLPQHVYWKDKNHKYQGCNKSIAKSLHLNTPADIIDKSDYDFGWTPERIKSLQDVDELILNEGINSIVEDTIPINGIPTIFLTSKTPMRNEEGEIIGILGISTDISERKKLEEDLRKATEAAEAANNAKTEFIANMSHDIRTPLTGVVGMSHMLEDSVTDAKQKSYAHMLGESGDQLLHMLNGILDVVSADNVNENDVHEEPFSLNRMIQDILELERPTTLVKGLGLNTQIDEAIPPCVVSDHTKIHRILLNLLGNAVKFTKEGYVEIGAKLLTCDKEQALIQFHVKDTGIGIPFELQDKVFDRFFRVTPSYKGIYTGHGVGLHIAQSYAHLLGGNILLTSEPNVGTTFYFDLSLRIGDPALLPSDPTRTYVKTPDPIPPPPIVEPLVDTNTPPLQSNAPMFLLVEDNAIALTILENLITKGGCNFMHAIDGLEALTLATTHDFDAIITDLGLPGLSGIEFTRKLRAFEREQHKPPTPIIGLTAHADVNVKNDCIQSGMNDTYTKPLTMDALDNIKSTYLALNNNAPPCETPNTAKNTEKAAGDIINNGLPDTEEALFELRKVPCLDPNVGINILGSIESLNKALTSLAQKNIPNDLDEIKRAHLLGDWATVERIAHRMRGGFVYTGNVKLSTACQYLENYHKAGHTIMLEALYQQVLDVSNETLVTINRWLSMQ